MSGLLFFPFHSHRDSNVITQLISVISTGSCRRFITRLLKALFSNNQTKPMYGLSCYICTFSIFLLVHKWKVRTACIHPLYISEQNHLRFLVVTTWGHQTPNTADVPNAHLLTMVLNWCILSQYTPPTIIQKMMCLPCRETCGLSNILSVIWNFFLNSTSKSSTLLQLFTQLSDTESNVCTCIIFNCLANEVPLIITK